jgi:hypothetical protein
VTDRPHRFDPARVGSAECAAWVAYYRRAWPKVLTGVFGMVRHGFALGPVRDLLGAWYVLRANQLWAPYPANHPEAARAYMARFYGLANAAGRLRVDPGHAATLELAWWRAHRERQREDAPAGELEARLVDLYAYVYGADPAAVRPAARLRAQAADLSDDWVAAGCRLDDPALTRERQTLIDSYAALQAATDPTPPPDRSGPQPG